ncbi:TetR/AcrR family transcriptional regulator [Streptomyces vietnamensis]|uniref:TetR/AcrR family transcriptional regulator n=1 Tax=Streptomyces vietnamensis TaxID=362257 RepID=UPI00069828CA|nr:TetR family transcriptional regulator C-terminal domain-containing protein [Streptomyces vietnamensis]
MPKIVDHRQRRAEIADAVLAIVAEEGVSGVTLREVADRSGWSTGVLNHYVGGRDDLLRLAFRHAFWLSGRRLATIADDTGLDPVERLVRVLTAQIPLDGPSVAFGRITLFFYAEAASSPEKLGQEMINYLRSWRSTVETHVRAALVFRDLPMSRAREIGDHLVALIDGYASYAVLGSNLWQGDDPTASPPVRTWVESALAMSTLDAVDH